MTEGFVWPEGVVAISTGVPFATSALLAYAEQTTVAEKWGWVNTPAADQTYYDHQTGQRADVQLGCIYTTDKTWLRIAEAETAVHLKFVYNNSAISSGGIFLYSGRIDNMQIVGQAAQVYKLSMTYHANAWSAF